MSNNNNRIYVNNTIVNSGASHSRNDSFMENAKNESFFANKKLNDMFEEVNPEVIYEKMSKMHMSDDLGSIKPVTEMDEEDVKERRLLEEIDSLNNQLQRKDKIISELQNRIKELEKGKSNTPMSMTIRDENRRMPALSFMDSDVIEELLLEADVARELFSLMKKDYLYEKAFLIDNQLKALSVFKNFSFIEPMKRMELSIHDTSNPRRCLCKICASNKVARIGKLSQSTVVDLSLISNSDLKLEFDSSTHEVTFKEPSTSDNLEGWAPSLEIKSLKFNKPPMRIFPSRTIMSKLMSMSYDKMFKSNMDIRSMGMSVDVPIRILFFVKQARDWVGLIGDDTLEQSLMDEERAVDIEESCFLKFITDSFRSRGLLNRKRFSSTRTITCINDLTFMEEIALQAMLVNKKVFVKYNPYTRNDSDNHISLKEFDGSDCIRSYRLSDPCLRNIHFYSSKSSFKNFDKSMEEVDITDENEDVESFSLMTDPEDENESLPDFTELDVEDETEALDSSHVYSDDNTNDIKRNNMNIRELTKTNLDSINKDAVWKEIKELDIYNRDYRLLTDSYNKRVISNLVNSMKTLILSSSRMETLDYLVIEDNNPSHVMRSAVASNLVRRFISKRVISQMVDNKLVSDLYKLNREDYPYIYMNLLSFTFKEFLLISFFWSDLKDFTSAILVRDLAIFSKMRTDLPSYMKMLLRRGMMLDVEDTSIDNKMDKLYKHLLNSDFCSDKQPLIKTLYMIFSFRVHNLIRGLEKAKTLEQNLNSSSWKDVHNCNIVNLNVTGNKNSWRNMFLNRMDGSGVKFINGATISISDKLSLEDEEVYLCKNMMSYSLTDEAKLYKGLSMMFTLMSLWSSTMSTD